jgi:N-acetylglucosamine-6-phosphate deacetylase
VQSNEAPNLIGIHLDGPFISSEEGYRGAHPAEFVLQPDLRVLDILIKADRGTIRMLTMSAELSGDATLCRSATNYGIVVSLGHQNAGLEGIMRMREAGARALTHFGNGVPLILRRHPNPLWAAAACEGLVTMAVPDGFHLSDDFFSTLLRLRSEQEIVFVSDLAPVAGLEPGQYEVFRKPACLGSDGSILDPKTGLCVGAGKSLLDSYKSSLGKRGPGWD